MVQAAPRNEARARRPWWAWIRLVVIPVLTPVALVLTNVRLLMTPAFISVEYRMPGFPEDPYGFTLQDRLHWAPIAREYLLNDAGSRFLGDLRFGDGSPVYNERELRHMEDVKRLTQVALRVWLACMAVIASGLLLLAWGKIGSECWRALMGGAQLTLSLMLALGLALGLSFDFIFVGFHRVFFSGDSWLFRYSDTLIRLFPERFWQDAFVFIAGATLVEAVALWVVARRMARRIRL